MWHCYTVVVRCTTNAVLFAVIAPAAPPPPVSKPASVMEAMTMQSKTGQVPQGQNISRPAAARLEL